MHKTRSDPNVCPLMRGNVWGRIPLLLVLDVATPFHKRGALSGVLTQSCLCGRVGTINLFIGNDGGGEADGGKLLYIASIVYKINGESHSPDSIAGYSIRLMLSSLVDTPNLLASNASRRSAVRIETSAVCATARWSASRRYRVG